MKKLIIAIAFILFAGVAFGQTLKQGCLLGVHNLDLTLKPGVTVEELIDFYTDKFIPEFEKAFPGVKIYLLKGLRGENEDGYGLVYYLESVEVRDKYWPEKDVNSELAKAAYEKLTPALEKLNKLATGLSVHTDWVVL